MGGDVSKNKKKSVSLEERRLSDCPGSPSIPVKHAQHSSPDRQGTWAVVRPRKSSAPEHPVLLTSPRHESPLEWTLPGFISLFLPDFPQRYPGQGHFQILGLIAKGSFGPILKVKDTIKDQVYAIKILPKSEILRRGVLDQSKEEVIIQRQVRHPFLLSLRDCWQSQRNLFIMCDYCPSGDLYTYWLLTGRFGEGEVRVFAAELGSAVGFLHDFGIMHRDVKMENILLTDQGHLRLADFGLSRRLERGERTYTICGTIQYMAPEVLSGGPYSHAADWWSLGILIYALATGEFPLSPEVDHSSMLTKVTDYSYDMPAALSLPLALLLSELLCKVPTRRLRCLEHYQRQTFFHGVPFDPHLLQKTPMEQIVELRNHPERQAKAMRGAPVDYFQNFDCDLLNCPPASGGLVGMETLTGSEAEIVPRRQSRRKVLQHQMSCPTCRKESMEEYF